MLKRILIGMLGGTVVRVVYSDETGTGSEKEEPITVVTALMLNMDAHWHSVQHDLDTLAGVHFIGEPQSKEFKGRLLYQDIKRGNAKASETVQMILAIALGHKIPLFYAAVDRGGLRTALEGGPVAHYPDQAHDIAFGECLMQVETYACAGLLKEVVLWIADKTGKEKAIKRSLSMLRQAQTLEQRDQELPRVWVGLAEPTIFHIADTIYFGHSEESRLLQLADVCCSTVGLHLRGDPIAQPYYAILRQQIIRESPVWFTRLGQQRTNS